MEVEIYGTPNCGACASAKMVCESRELSYTYYDIEADTSKMMELIDMIGAFRTVPQIFINGDHVGGFTDFKEKIDDHD